MLCNAFMRVQPGTLISLKKWKRKTKFCAITFYMMHQGISSGELYLNYLFHKGVLYTRYVNWVLDVEFSKLWLSFYCPPFFKFEAFFPKYPCIWKDLVLWSPKLLEQIEFLSSSGSFVHNLFQSIAAWHLNYL